MFGFWKTVREVSSPTAPHVPLPGAIVIIIYAVFGWYHCVHSEHPLSGHVTMLYRVQGSITLPPTILAHRTAVEYVNTEKNMRYRNKYWYAKNLLIQG
jgi:hypothetical protein